MEIPNLPTDNLYKFMAISGTLMFLFSFSFPIIYDYKLCEQIFKTKEEAGKLVAEYILLDEDYERINGQLDEIETYIKENNLSDTMKIKMNLERLANKIYDQNFREVVKFLYKYQNFLFPTYAYNNEKIEKVTFFGKELNKKYKELKIKYAEIKVKNEYISELTRKEDVLFLINKFLLFLSLIIMFLGYIFWFFFQKKIDKKILMEIEMIKKSSKH